MHIGRGPILRMAPSISISISISSCTFVDAVIGEVVYLDAAAERVELHQGLGGIAFPALYPKQCPSLRPHRVREPMG
jgi:hypothetical protein